MKLKEIKKIVFDYDQQQNPEFDLISKYRGRYISIMGNKGSGKTSFLVAIKNIFFQLNRQIELEKHIQDVLNLRARGFNNIKPLTHLIYGDDGKGHTICKLGLGQIDYKAMKKEWFKNFFRPKNKKNNEIIFVKGTEPAREHYFDFNKARMPNFEEPYIHFPKGSILTTSELVDRVYNSKGDKNEIDINKLDFIQKIRHKNITLIDETQLWSRCQKWLRDTLDILIILPVNARKDKYLNGQRISTTWEYWLYNGSNELKEAGFNGVAPFTKKELKNLDKTKTNSLKTQIEVKTLTFYGDIEKLYDSTSHEYEFDYGLNYYELEKTQSVDFGNYTKGNLDNEFNRIQKLNQEKKEIERLNKLKIQASELVEKEILKQQYKNAKQKDNIENKSE